MTKRFIERDDFPAELINEKSEKEKQGGGRPPHWEMVFWWTRKPLIGARAVIAGALLPKDISIQRFETLVNLSGNIKIPHRLNPQIANDLKPFFEGKKLLDPFAGFGSIPLEAMRLGLDVTAVELLPTAYVFLKAVLEYPAKYGNQLVEDVKRWGDWVTDQLRNDPDIRELYEDDVAVYIGTWEIKCPHCGRWTPLVGNWWLARVKDSRGTYQRLAFMDYEKSKDGIEIRVVDLNKILGRNFIENAKLDTNKGEIKIEDNFYRVPLPNLNSRREQATCLNCGNLIRFVDANESHYTDKQKVTRDERSGLEWYVKWALKKYHEGDEGYARQRLLVKVKVFDGNLCFEPCDAQDTKKLKVAKDKIQEYAEKNKLDIPLEPQPTYDDRHFLGTFGFTQWQHLFNPRQLLTLVKLVKLIREAGKRIEEEKILEGWSKEEAFKYAEAVVSYLGIGLVKFADYNCLSTLVDVANPWGVKIAHALSMRGIAMQWNWGDTNPLVDSMRVSGILQETSSLNRSLGGIINSLTYITSSLQNSHSPSSFIETEQSNGKAKVFLDDATTLSKINEKFDLIVTDPPYADDVPYTELSDFYYVWLKRALSDVENGRLVPRFIPEAFFKKIGDKYVEIKTQWQEFAMREVSTNAGRFQGKGNEKEKARNHFKELLTQSFISMKNKLKEDGIIVTYYAHTSPEAWSDLLYAGWKGAKLNVTNAFPLTTESQQSIVKRGKLSLDTSIIVVWRKKKLLPETTTNRIYSDVLHSAKRRAYQTIGRHFGRDVLIGTLSSALNVLTSYEAIYLPDGSDDMTKILTDFVYPILGQAIAEALSEKVKGAPIRSPDALFYLMAKILFSGIRKKEIAKNDVILLRISTHADVSKLEREKIIKKGEKGYLLIDPPVDPNEMPRFLREREINPHDPKPRNSVDVLHILEYYGYFYNKDQLMEKREEFPPDMLKEADSLMKMLKELGDTEAELAKKTLDKEGLLF